MPRVLRNRRSYPGILYCIFVVFVRSPYEAIVRDFGLPRKFLSGVSRLARSSRFTTRAYFEDLSTFVAECLRIDTSLFCCSLDLLADQ